MKLFDLNDRIDHLLQVRKKWGFSTPDGKVEVSAKAINALLLAIDGVMVAHYIEDGHPLVSKKTP